MISRALSVTFVSALVIGAYVGCGDASTDPTGGAYRGQGGPVDQGTASSGSGSSSGGSSSGGSGGSSSGSSSGSSGSGSSSGSSSSSGGDAGGPAQEAGPPPITVQQAFTDFANCMSLTDFTDKSANGVAAADIAKSQTTQYGDCNACHNQGDGGFWASYGTVQGQNMTQVMFDQTKTFPYIAKWVTATVDANGQFKDLAPSNAIANQATLAAQCQAGSPCHPKFQLNPAVAQAITDFVNTTISKWHNNQCSAAPPPQDAGGGG